MTVIPSEHRFIKVRERRKLKLVFPPVDGPRQWGEPPKGDAA